MILDAKGNDGCRVPAEIIDKFRRLACSYTEKHLFKSASFWADKVAAFSRGAAEDVFLLARTLFLDGQYARAADVITRANLHYDNDACRCLAAEAFRRCKNNAKAEAVIFASPDEDITDPNVSHERASRLTSFGRSKLGAHASHPRLEQQRNADGPMSPFGSAVSNANTASGGHASVASRLMKGSMSQTGKPVWSPGSSGKFPISLTPKETSTPVLRNSGGAPVAPTAASTPLVGSSGGVGVGGAKRTTASGLKAHPAFAGMEDVWNDCRAIECLIKAQIAEAGDNRAGAAEYYKDALMIDLFCQEAFQSLVRNHMLSPGEEAALLDSLPWSSLSSELEVNLVRSLYSLAMKRVDSRVSVTPIPEVFVPALERNSDVMVWRAKHFFADSDYRHSLKMIKATLNADPHHPDAMPIYLACLMELREVNELFRVAHDLVDKLPEESLTWYAVGCYYYLTDKLEPARRYLMKATTLDKYHGAAWLMYGHAFAVDAEHDQSMSAYYKAHHIMKGCHLPLLYVGLGYENSKSYVLAKEFFVEALAIAPYDPFTLHELGVVCFYERRYTDAEKYMLAALEQVDRENRLTPFPEKWEPLLNNLGHVSRKLQKYDESLKYHRRALSVKPKSASTYAALGYLMTWKGQLWSAASFLHQALALRRDDTLSNELLNHVVEALAQNDDETYLNGPVGPDGPDPTCRDIESAIAPDKDGLRRMIRTEQDVFGRYASAFNKDLPGGPTPRPGAGPGPTDGLGFRAEIRRFLPKFGRKKETTAGQTSGAGEVSLGSPSDMDLTEMGE